MTGRMVRNAHMAMLYRTRGGMWTLGGRPEGGLRPTPSPPIEPGPIKPPEAEDDDCCEEIYRKINAVSAELKTRFRRQKKNKSGSYPGEIRPDGGMGSWDGHEQQIREKQRNLKKLLEEASELGCFGAPVADGYYWAWKPLPVYGR